MATVDASVAGTAHGTLTADTAEVISFGSGGRVFVENRGTVVMYGQYGAEDLDVADQGTEAIAPGRIVQFAGDSGVAGTICLKSTGTPDYSISRFPLLRIGGGGGTGGTVISDTEFPAAAALSDAAGNPTTPTVGSAGLYWTGSAWARWQQNVKTLTVAAATLANVAGSATSVTLLASNTAARGRIIHNDSTAALYVKFGATASTTSYTVRLDPDAYYEFPAPLYTGVVDGVWSSATGSARVTES
jgi:hypothetical protein